MWIARDCRIAAFRLDWLLPLNILHLWIRPKCAITAYTGPSSTLDSRESVLQVSTDFLQPFTIPSGHDMETVTQKRENIFVEAIAIYERYHAVHKDVTKSIRVRPT